MVNNMWMTFDFGHILYYMLKHHYKSNASNVLSKKKCIAMCVYDKLDVCTK